MTMQHRIATAHESANPTTPPGRFLRRVLLANASFSTLIGLLLLGDAALIAPMLHLPARALTSLGVIIVIAAAVIAWLATRSQLDRRVVKLIFWLDCAWVVTSVVVLLTGLLPLTPGGKWAIGGVADIVALFALLEFWGLRRVAGG